MVFNVVENIQNIQNRNGNIREKAAGFTVTVVLFESKLLHQTDLNINALRPCLYEMSKSHFFLSYFKYFKPRLVQCLNKLWHWTIFTPLPSHWLHIDVPCVRWEGFPQILPDLNHHRGDKKKSILRSKAVQFWGGGNAGHGEKEEICRQLEWEGG